MKAKRRSGVTIERLPEPPFDRLIRRRLLSSAWFPLDITSARQKKLERGLVWLLGQPGLLGSQWHCRHVWFTGRYYPRYEYWGPAPDRVFVQWRRNPIAHIDVVDAERRRVRLRLCSGSTKWIALCDLVHMWRLVALKRLPTLPKGVRRKRLPAVLASVRVTA